MHRFIKSRFKAKERRLAKLLVSLAAFGLASCGVVQSAWESEAFDQLDEFITAADTALDEALGNPDTRSFSFIGLDLPRDVDTYFGVFAGGGAPSYNEIALEKNVLYFQRSLAEMGLSSEAASLFFASDNFLEETIRYIDEDGTEQFKRTEIPNLDGSATVDNLYSWILSLSVVEKPCPAFFYFTGHGALNPQNEDDNAMYLWGNELLPVTEMANLLDNLPTDQPFVTMMAQCYSGSFANLIYEGGDPSQPVALQTRCGFFATVASRPSVGCTPEVNEADYKDYSSSFFAGLTGRDRIGNPTPNADYNQDGKVSYAEAHAFAKVNGETTDWPISTVEAWLQRQASDAEIQEILETPIEALGAIARPEQQHVITSLAPLIGFETSQSYTDNLRQTPQPNANTVTEAYFKRLEMELINIDMERRLRERQSPEDIAILEKLISCEAGQWR